MRCYVLRDRKIVRVTVLEWCEFMDSADRCVRNTIVGGFEVSTVFLGLDHNFSNHGEPVLWETMVFDGSGGRRGFDQHRCSGSIEQAESMHERVVRSVEAVLGIARATT